MEPRDAERRSRLLPVSVCDSERRMCTATVQLTGNTSAPTRNVVFNERLTLYVYNVLHYTLLTIQFTDKRRQFTVFLIPSSLSTASVSVISTKNN